jgi:hypothetical protein
MLNRKVKRAYLRMTPSGKRLAKLNFFHPDKAEARRKNIEQGKIAHEDFTQKIQERLSETLAPKEAEITNKLKELSLNKAQIDEYMEIWATINFWPKDRNHHSLRKQLMKLNKEYNVNG